MDQGSVGQAQRPGSDGRVQLALNVDDLEQSVSFYTALFGVSPAKLRDGYANFTIASPPLKLVLLENPGRGGTLNHLGVEVQDTEAVASHAARLRDSGLAIQEEPDTTCCYATQDKVWVHGPGAEEWEIYTVLADSAAFGTGPYADPAASLAGGPAVCCEPADGAVASSASACC